MTKRNFVLAGLTLAIAMAIAATTTRPPDPVGTAIGERKHITLPDGSALHAGARTHYEVAFTDERRQVTLHSGELVLDITTDSARPFTVITSRVDLTALGTRFGVLIDSGATTTTVSEGVVRAVVHKGRREFILEAGAQLRVPDDESTPPAHSKVDAQKTLQWTSGRLVFDGAEGVTIGQAVLELNRHNVAQIEIGDATISERVLRGYFHVPVDAPSQFARAVADKHSLALIEDRSGGVLRLRLEKR